jgi:hypothetical protein
MDKREFNPDGKFNIKAVIGSRSPVWDEKKRNWVPGGTMTTADVLPPREAGQGQPSIVVEQDEQIAA